MTAEKAAEILFNCATLLELAGANPHRIGRYRYAAQVMLRLGPEAAAAVKDAAILRALGFGERLTRKLQELFSTGSLAFYEDLLGDLPYGVVRLMQVPGVGPKRAWQLYQELGVNSPAALARAARDGRVRALRGFGPRREEQYSALARLPLERRPTPLPVPQGQLAFEFAKAA